MIETFKTAILTSLMVVSSFLGIDNFTFGTNPRVLTVQQGGTGASTLTGCLEGNGTGAITGTGSNCGSGGSGGGGGTFSTTTSTVSGQLINYPNNTTDIVNIGSNATTTGEVWFDPNTQRYQIGSASTASTTLMGNLYLPHLSQGFAYLGSNSKLNSIASSSINLSWFNNDAGFLTSPDGYGFTTDSYGGLTVQSTSTTLWLKDLTPYSLIASTSLINYASTTQISIGSDYLTDADGTGLTISGAGVLNCDTASGSVQGCLTSTDWTTFNNKLGSYDAWTHPAAGKSATTSEIWMNGLISSASSTVTGLLNLYNNANFYAGSEFAIEAETGGTISFNDTGLSNQWSVIGSDANETLYFADNTATKKATLNLASLTAPRTYSFFDLPGGLLVGSTTLSNGYIGLATTTPVYRLTVHDNLAPQFSLSAGAGLAQWVFRNAGGTFYLATTTVAGTATTSIAVLEADNSTTTLRNLIEEKNFIIGDGTNTITTGAYAGVQVPYNATIVEWSLFSIDPSTTSCSIVVDLWKDTYANYPPAVADSITASAKPTLSSVTKNFGAPTGWITRINEGDFIKPNVDSVTGCKQITLKLKLKRQ